MRLGYFSFQLFPKLNINLYKNKLIADFINFNSFLMSNNCMYLKVSCTGFIEPLSKYELFLDLSSFFFLFTCQIIIY